MLFRSLVLGAVLLAVLPSGASAGEITLLPSIKLQIGDRDRLGYYWDGDRWRDRDYWHKNWKRHGGHWYRDNGRHRGWEQRRAWKRGYIEGRHDRYGRGGPRGGWHKHHR